VACSLRKLRAGKSRSPTSSGRFLAVNPAYLSLLGLLGGLKLRDLSFRMVTHEGRFANKIIDLVAELHRGQARVSFELVNKRYQPEGRRADSG